VHQTSPSEMTMTTTMYTTISTRQDAFTITHGRLRYVLPIPPLFFPTNEQSPTPTGNVDGTDGEQVATPRHPFFLFIRYLFRHPFLDPNTYNQSYVCSAKIKSVFLGIYSRDVATFSTPHYPFPTSATRRQQYCLYECLLIHSLLNWSSNPRH
jgi:hypothetical protein